MDSFDVKSERPAGAAGNQVRKQNLQRYNKAMPKAQILPCRIGYMESYLKVSKKGVEREWFEVWVVLPGKEYVKLKVCGAIKDKPDTLTQRAWDLCYLLARQNPDVFSKNEHWISSYEPFERTSYPLAAHMPMKVAIVDNGRGEYNGYWSYEGEFLDHDTEKTAQELRDNAPEAKGRAEMLQRLQKRHDEAAQEQGGTFKGYGQQAAPAPAQAAPAGDPMNGVPPLADDIPF